VCFRKEAPPKGTPVSTPAGEGVIVGYNVPKDAITVRFEDGSYSDIRLSGCQCLESGGLRVVPEEDKPPFGPILEDVSGLEALATAERASDDLTVVEAEVITGANGEAVEVVVAEVSRRGRGRRGRGRRGGRARARLQAQAAEAAALTSDDTAGETTVERRTGGHRRTPRSGRRAEQRPDQRPGKGHEGAGESPGGVSGAEQPGASTSGRSRRRRRSRGKGDGAGDSGGGGAE
jgi:hypothetical protein